MASFIVPMARLAVVVAVATFVVWSPAVALAEISTFQPDPKLQKSSAVRHKKALKAAAKLAKKNPFRYAEFVPADPDLTPGTREVSFSTPDGDSTAVVESLLHTVVGLGHVELKSNNLRNLRNAYTHAYQILPPSFRTGLEPPAVVNELPKRKLMTRIVAIADLMRRDFNPIRLAITETVAIPTFLVNPIKACTAEIGWESGGDDGERSERCAVGDYADDGIMKNVDFVLKEDLTCVKDQGARGTCVAHAVNAVVESTILATGGDPENLSEQNLYFWAVVTTNFADRHLDGLYPDEVYDALIERDYKLQYEDNWNYNRSPDRDSIDSSNQYPNSCGPGYTGELCTNFAHQGDETTHGASTTLTRPSPLPTGWEIRDWTSIPDGTYIGQPEWQMELAILALESKFPLHLSFDVPPSFLDPNSNGYITFRPGEDAEDVLGSHSAVAVAFVSNADLPSGAPTDPAGRGYFVIKNSWGIGFADCGFVYVPSAFADRWFYAYRFIDKELL